MVPPGVTVVVERMGVLEEGAKKGEDMVEEGVEEAVVGVRGRDEASAGGAPKREERRDPRRPIVAALTCCVGLERRHVAGEAIRQAFASSPQLHSNVMMRSKYQKSVLQLQK